MGRATQPQLVKLKLLFDEHGVRDRGDRLRLCSDHAGRLLSSSALLSRSEAHQLIERLERLPRDGTVLRAADRLAERLLAAARAEQENDDTETLPDVFCPFSSDGHCPGNPPCPSPRERACIGDDE